MSNQVLTTKLFIPTPPPNLVSRPRLLQILERGARGRLTLISAQAGSGKSTLLSEWISQSSRPVCWLSLDEGDNDLQRFLKYVIAALQRINPDFGRGALLEYQSPKPVESELLLTGLINDIAAAAGDFVFVLDDYHVITAPEIQHVLLFLLDHAPPQMHLIIASRSDPPWPLARLKVGAEILEIRAQDMRFTSGEAASFLNEAMGLELSLADVAALERRTEGWIAGLQLTALSLRQRPDKAVFIQTFTGSHRFVFDYLVEEVLAQQPPAIHTFLLKTSILTRLTGSLCDALLEGQDSQQILQDLEQKNLFLTPLDDERRWYRYHQLFAELLKHYLRQSYPGEVLSLHRKASRWYEAHELFADAVSHALTADDIERIVQLTDEMTVYKLDHAELVALLRWLERLPESALAQYPALLVTRTWAFFNLGSYEAVETSLAEIERVLSNRALPAALAQRMRGHAAAIRSYYAELMEDPQAAIQGAEAAYGLLPGEDIRLRAFVATRWANALAWLGELDKAISLYREAGEASRLVGEGQLAITALSEMAVIQMLAGKLRQAVESMAELTQYAETLAKRDGRRLPAMGILYRHLSYLKREQNELAEAGYYAREAIKICAQWGEKESHLMALMALARVQFAQGEFEPAERSFSQIMQLARQISIDHVRQFVGWIIHYRILMGELEQVAVWVEQLGLQPGDEFGYERQSDYLNFAHYLAARGNCAPALAIVDRLLHVAAEAGAGMSAIRYRVLQAVLLDALKKNDQALAAMGRALSLARAEGYVRTLLDEGQAVGDLLRRAIAQGIEVAYASRLLQALNEEQAPSPARLMQAAGLVDPLSEREVEVLRLLGTDLSTPEIAAELYISVSTVRSHIKQIYSKLDVHSRRQALSKARELNLV